MPTLFHYTDESGYRGILATNVHWASTVARNPPDVRFGNVQYPSDIKPGTMTSAQRSRVLLGHPFSGKRFTHFFEIDIAGLNVRKCREHVFCIPGDQPLDLVGRIVRSGGA